MLFNKSILVLKCVHLLFLCYVTDNRRMITTIQYVIFVSLELKNECDCFSSSALEITVEIYYYTYLLYPACASCNTHQSHWLGTRESKNMDRISMKCENICQISN